MKKHLLTLAALGFALPAAAQENDTIVVLGSVLPLPPGTPAYGSVTIDRSRLTDSASGRIENVLTDVAGFQQFRRSDSRSANPSAQGATLRALGGNASSRTLVLLDGVPVADPFFGYIPFNALVPERLSLIRVTRGGGVGAFGAGAVAGTIELGSATRADLPLLSAGAFYGSRDSSELSAAFSPDLGAGFLSVSGRWDRGDGFWTTPKSQRVSASVPARYESWSTSIRAVAPLGSDLEIQARATVFRDNRTLRFAGADSFSEGEDASIRLIGRGAWKIDALAYVQARDFGNVVISSNPPFRKSLDQRKTPSTGVGGKIELRPPLNDAHVLRLGSDLRISTGDMFEDAYNATLATNPRTNLRHAGARQTTLGLFAEDDWTLGSLVLTGGVRADHWKISDGFYHVTVLSGVAPVNPCAAATACASRSDWQVSGRAGALLQVNDGMALRAAAYTGFRLPTLNELYRSFVVFPIATQANPGLKPEKLKGVEAGFDLQPAVGLTFSATVFYNRLGNAIANATINATTRKRQNVDSIVAKGIELNASAKLQDFTLSASYAYTDSTVKAPGQLFDHLRPAQTPRHSASGTLAWAPNGGPSLSTTLRYVGRQYEDDLQTDALPHALTVDATASVPLGHHASLVGRVENLFDKAVYTRNAGGSIDLGTPQTFWIGIRFAH
ncbi:TonB-dependent receptor [Sphingobium sp. DEHP117]|uniref:TonB-dependent receptor plug domain-containing protein n=1 Tax=Sphingobium sp. DEHP117 TaxID=2993436 RepID=UPI0027D550C5|nr:TonB-dependent receptor [Sphingobium sp. DEHP117]MDQ4421524.1 TonB-dependent receptor [Sphingobium sp. DEHP117]